MQAGMTALNSHGDTPPEQSTSFSSEPNSPRESVFRALAVRRGRDWRNSAVRGIGTSRGLGGNVMGKGLSPGVSVVAEMSIQTRSE